MELKHFTAQAQTMMINSVSLPLLYCIVLCRVIEAYPLQATAISGGLPWQVATVCSPLDAGRTDVMTDRNDRPIADFRDTERPPLSTN